MSSISLDYPASSLQENPRPHGQVLSQDAAGTTSHQRFAFLTTD